MKSNSHLKKNHSNNCHVALSFLLLAKALIKSAEWFIFSSSDFRCYELPKHFFSVRAASLCSYRNDPMYRIEQYLKKKKKM